MLSLISKNSGVIVLMSDKGASRIKKVTSGKEEHFMMTKEAVHQEVVTMLTVYGLTNAPSKMC